MVSGSVCLKKETSLAISALTRLSMGDTQRGYLDATIREENEVMRTVEEDAEDRSKWRTLTCCGDNP